MKIKIIVGSLLMVVLFSCQKSGASNCGVPPLSIKCVDPSKIDSEVNCADIYRPVCGCDGNTYENSCDAYRSGVSSWEYGPCCED